LIRSAVLNPLSGIVSNTGFYAELYYCCDHL